MFQEFLTTEGERLLAKSITGEATITFTKMELGDGDRGTGSKSIEHLESKRMTLDIYSVRLSGDNHITITSMLKSENIEEGFYLREKGIYATDGTTEILFMYGTAGSLAEWIDHSSTAVFERTMRTIIALSEGDNISVTIQDGVYASGEDMEQIKTDILTAISDIKLDGDWAKYEQAESILSLLDTFVTAYTTLRAGKLDNLDALVSSRAPANTALSNAVWTDTRAAKLDTLDRAISTRAPLTTALSNEVWTTARAAKLDNLDAKISSRAPASTALSNATWTNVRAGKLDNIDTTVSSRAAASTALSNAVWTDARAGYIDNIVDSVHGLPVVAHYVYNTMINVGNTADTGGGVNTGTVMAKLNSIMSMLSAGTGKMSCVKQIINGTAYLSSGSDYEQRVSLTQSYNKDKCIVLITGLGYEATGYHAWATEVYYELGTNYIELWTNKRENTSGVNATFQIVEFY